MNALNYLNKKRLLSKFSKKSVFTKNKEIDPYLILGVKRTADINEIKKKYFELAKMYHPDINKDPNSIEKFKSIKAAFEIIGIPQNRYTYDLENNIENDTIKYTYKGKTSSVLFGPRKMTDLYNDKWTEFKKPKWTNSKYGMDYKNEYMENGKEENYSQFDASITSIRFFNFIVKYRAIIFILFIFSIDLIYIFINKIYIRQYSMHKRIFVL